MGVGSVPGMTVACSLPIPVAAKHVVHRVGSYLAATNSVTSQIFSADGLFCRVLWWATSHHLYKTCCSTQRGISKVLLDDSWRLEIHPTSTCPCNGMKSFTIRTSKGGC